MLDDLLKKKSNNNYARLEAKIRKASNEYFHDLSRNISTKDIISVSHVEIARGKYFLRIWVGFSNQNKENVKDYKKFLKTTEPHLKHFLAQHIEMFKIPPIKLILDDSFEYVKTIEKLLG